MESGLRIVSRQDDSLSAALPNKEHTGRVRGEGSYKGWKDTFTGPRPRIKRPRAKVDQQEMESQLAEVRQQLAEMESRLMTHMQHNMQPPEHATPISPGIRRSSQGSGTEVLCGLDNLKVITT